MLEPAGTHFEMENTFGTRVGSSLSLQTAAVIKYTVVEGLVLEGISVTWVHRGLLFHIF